MTAREAVARALEAHVGGLDEKFEEYVDQFMEILKASGFCVAKVLVYHPRGPTVRAYRFYILRTRTYGEPFALCDKHHAEYTVPRDCVIERLCDKTDRLCNKCEQEARGGAGEKP